jgi:hypothetical protein
MPSKSSGGYGGERERVGGLGAGGRGMGGGTGGGLDSRTVNPRTSVSPIASRPATVSNIVQGTLGSLPGPSMIAKAGAFIGGYDPYSGPVGTANRYDYDGSNLAASQNQMGAAAGTVDPMRQKILDQLIQMNPKWADVLKARGLMPTPTAPQAPAAAPQTPPGLAPQTVPAATLGGPVPGLADYKMNAPAYGYFGLPGQKRPTAASLGGY